MVMGDFNAWVSKNSKDYIEDDNVLEFSSLPEGTYTPDTLLPRNTMELKENNKNGNCLINLCRTVSLRLLNGRSFGDSFGRFTRYPLKDSELPSVIDYSLVDTEIITLVKFFQISQLFFFSDHCCIKAHIRANFSV